MSVDIRPVPRAEWSPVPAESAVGVESKALVHEEDLFVAILRFTKNATIHEHPGQNDTVVVCLDGEGFTSVAGDTAPLKAGRQASPLAEETSRIASGPKARRWSP